MSLRWRILAVLFLVRTTMAFQFQSVAALSPLMMEAYGVGLADVGLIFGLYLAPGVLIALPSGALGRILGGRRAVTIGLAMMTLGGVLMAGTESWQMHLAGRVLAGIGGVVLNVLMTKMVADWFAGREIATAMAIFVNSWPVGIALALVALPPVAAVLGYAAALWAVAALAGAGLALFATSYRVPPAGAAPTAAATSGWPSGAAARGALLAGAVWGLYNGGLGMVFGFAPALLVERGWSVAEGSGATSMMLWGAAISTPLGGYLADRTRRPDGVLLAGLALFAVCLGLAAVGTPGLALFAFMGLAAGLPAGPIMSLPARVLTPGVAALGMGLFFTVFYVFVMGAPAVVGRIADQAGSAGVAFPAGIAMLAAAALALVGVRRMTRIVPRQDRGVG